MLKIFDGFVAAISSETKIPFFKDDNNNYTATLEFDNDRKQKVFITFDKDEAGDGIIRYYSVICHLNEQQHSLELFRDALRYSSSLDYGAVALMENVLVLVQTAMFVNLEVRSFMKSLIYVAAKADELEEALVKVDEA